MEELTITLTLEQYPPLGYMTGGLEMVVLRTYAAMITPLINSLNECRDDYYSKGAPSFLLATYRDATNLVAHDKLQATLSDEQYEDLLLWLANRMPCPIFLEVSR